MSDTTPRPRGRPRRTTPPPPRFHPLLSPDEQTAQAARLADVLRRVQVAWGDRLTLDRLALLAGLCAGALRHPKRRLSDGVWARLDALADELARLSGVLSDDLALCEARVWLKRPGALYPGEHEALTTAAQYLDRLGPEVDEEGVDDDEGCPRRPAPVTP